MSENELAALYGDVLLPGDNPQLSEEKLSYTGVSVASVDKVISASPRKENSYDTLGALLSGNSFNYPGGDATLFGIERRAFGSTDIRRVDGRNAEQNLSGSLMSRPFQMDGIGSGSNLVRARGAVSSARKVRKLSSKSTSCRNSNMSITADPSPLMSTDRERGFLKAIFGSANLHRLWFPVDVNQLPRTEEALSNYLIENLIPSEMSRFFSSAAWNRLRVMIDRKRQSWTCLLCAVPRNRNMIECTDCHQWFHLCCVAALRATTINSTPVSDESWVCIFCVQRMRCCTVVVERLPASLGAASRVVGHLDLLEREIHRSRQSGVAFTYQGHCRPQQLLQKQQQELYRQQQQLQQQQNQHRQRHQLHQPDQQQEQQQQQQERFELHQPHQQHQQLLR